MGQQQVQTSLYATRQAVQLFPVKKKEKQIHPFTYFLQVLSSYSSGAE